MILRVFRRVAALVGLFTLAIGAAPASAEWHRASNEHFVLYADMPPAELQRMAERLERFDAAMRFLTKARETRPVTIYMVRNSDVASLAGSRNIGGFYAPSAQEQYIVTPRDTPRDAQAFDYSPTAVLQHEYAHHMLLSNVDQFLPSWANEGMAEFLATAVVRDNGPIVLGATPTFRGFTLMSTNRWTARDLLLSETRRVPRADVPQRYARGWLLIHYLLMTGDRGPQYAQYIDALNAGKPTAQAATEVFGDLGKLDSDMQRHLRQTRFPRKEILPAQLGELKPVTVERVSAGTAAIMPFRIRSAIGVTAETAGPLAVQAAPVAARFAEDAFVQRALSEIEYDAKDYPAAIAAADRALAVDPNLVMAMVYRGRALAQQAKADSDPEKWREARRWFLRANRADPNHAQPFVSYYDSFAAAGETPNESAETGLLRAIVLTPQDPSLHVRVALLRLRAGQLGEARRLLSPAAFNPHAGEENPARDAVRMMDEGATAEAILAAVGDKLGVNEFVHLPKDEGED